MKMLRFIIPILFVVSALMAANHPLIWKDFQDTRTAPYEYNSNQARFEVTRTAAGQDSDIVSTDFNFGKSSSNAQFHGLVTLTIRHDSLPYDSGWADNDGAGNHRPDTLSYYLQQLHGVDWVTIVDTIEWRLASNPNLSYKRIFLPARFGDVLVWSNIPSDTSSTARHRHALNTYRVGLRFDDFQDSARFGIDNRAYGY